LDGYRAGLRRAIEAEAMDRLSVPEEHAPGVRRRARGCWTWSARHLWHRWNAGLKGHGLNEGLRCRAAPR
ncbi:hypothetical protein CTI14_50405, partial [Methylobacterium radiotolerans]